MTPRRVTNKPLQKKSLRSRRRNKKRGNGRTKHVWKSSGLMDLKGNTELRPYFES